eukprot:scaffold234672_cov29-Tisochrysis_lutea.AAC.3
MACCETGTLECGTFGRPLDRNAPACSHRTGAPPPKGTTNTSSAVGVSNTASARRNGEATSVPPPKEWARKSSRRFRDPRSIGLAARLPALPLRIADAFPRLLRRRCQVFNARLRAGGERRSSARLEAPEKAKRRHGRPTAFAERTASRTTA